MLKEARADHEPAAWQDEIFEALRVAGIRQVAYVPDAGHASLIARVHAERSMRAVVLTTEEEGIALACGAWLGGDRSAVLMQSSGIGNCINMLAVVEICRFPLVCLVTMRGEWAEFNPWQVPMGRAAAAALELMGVQAIRVDRPEDARSEIEGAIDAAFLADRAVAILLGQRLVGRKVWAR